MSSEAVIGRSIVFKGELSGGEDLTIEGTVEGKITLSDNNVVVGAEGKVAADVYAKAITITGTVEGNVNATDVVEITASGSLKGNIRAPRLVITDGAFFQGSVEMKAASSGMSMPKSLRPEKSTNEAPQKMVGKAVVEVA